MSSSARDRLRGAWSQVARVTIVPEAAGGAAPWPGALVVATGVAIGGAAWLGARLIMATRVVPAVGGLCAVVLAIVLGAALIERGLHAAAERWLGARWASLVVGGALLTRVVALWSIAPRRWLGALVLSAAVGRWAAIGLQRLGDVAEATRGRTLVVGPIGWVELAVTSIVVVALAMLVGGTAAVAVVVVATLVAAGLGVGAQLLDRELAGDSLAAIAAAIELVVLCGLTAVAPAAWSPFVR